MSRSAAVKEEFHKLIDSIEDPQLLEKFYQLLYGFQSDNSQVDIIDQLTPDQLQHLNASIAQAKSGQTLAHDEVKANVKKWLTQ